MSGITIVLVVWIPICVSLFAIFRPVSALTAAYLIGWLALPVGAVPIQGFWDLDKTLATNVGAIVGVLLFSPKPFARYKPGVAEFSLFVFAVLAFATAMANDLGMYYGGSAAARRMFYYGTPFVLGRALLHGRRQWYEAVRLVVCGAALYAVFAIWEWRMSPQIHETLYGYRPLSQGWVLRWGFWRAVVCFPNTIGLATFFMWTSLLSLAMWRSGRLRPVFGIPPGSLALLPVLGLLTTVSVGPLALFVVGAGIIIAWNQTRMHVFLWLAPAFAALWMAGRYTGLSDGQWLTAVVEPLSSERAESLQYRVTAEDLMIERSWQRPILGWGGWGRGRPRTLTGEYVMAADGLWIIFAGSSGLAGLAAFYAWWLWPMWMASSASRALETELTIRALLVAIGLQGVNFLFNGFLSPVLILVSGGAVTALAQMRVGAGDTEWRARARSPVAPLAAVDA